MVRTIATDFPKMRAFPHDIAYEVVLTPARQLRAPPSHKRKTAPMRMLAYLLGIACLAAAAMYYTIPAGQLPAFIPGHLDGSAHIHKTHAYAAAAGAFILFVFGWYFGRARSTA
jgi:hypothetical protein